MFEDFNTVVLFNDDIDLDYDEPYNVTFFNDNSNNLLMRL